MLGLYARCTAGCGRDPIELFLTSCRMPWFHLLLPPQEYRGYARNLSMAVSFGMVYGCTCLAESRRIARLSFATCEHSFFPSLTSESHRGLSLTH